MNAIYNIAVDPSAPLTARFCAIFVVGASMITFVAGMSIVLYGLNKLFRGGK